MLSTASIWGYTLASVAAVSFVSFGGALFLFGQKRFEPAVFVLVSLAVGAMLGDAFIHLLPESFETIPNPLQVSISCLAGILAFFVLEKFLMWRHDHASEHTHPVLPLGHINLVADGVHNFIDGVLIGASYLAGVEIGLATTMAVLLHEIPQELGDFGILVSAGFTRSKALWMNFLTALVSVAGAVLVLVIGPRAEELASLVIPLAAGGFVYIAGSDLVPELHKERELPRAAIQFVAIGVGVGLMLLLKIFG